MNPKDSRIAWYIKQLTKLSLNPRIKIIGYDKDEFLDIINLLFGPIVDEKGNPLFPEDFRYLACALYQLEQISSMEEYLQRRSVPQEAIEGAKNLAEIKPKEKEALAQAKTKVGRFIQEQEELARQANQLSANQLAQAEKNITQEVERIIKERVPQLVSNQPEVVDKLIEEFKEEVLTNCFESPRQALGPEAYQAIIDQALPRIDLVIAEENIPLSPGEKEALEQGLKEITKTTLPEASALTQIDFKLPKSVQEKIPVQGTAFSPVAAAFHPVDLVRKLSQPSAIAAQMVMAGEISDEEAIKQQLVKELRSPKRDLQRITQLVNTLREMEAYKLSSRELRYSVYGLSSQDFQKAIDYLQEVCGAGDPAVRFLEIQKRRQEEFELKFPSASKKNRFSSFLNQQMGQRPSVVELRGTYTSLPSPEPLGKMSQVFNQIGTVSHFYQVSSQFPGIRQIESLPFQKIADFRSLVYRRTLHPLFHRLAQTSFGQAIKTGITTAFKETTKKAISEGIKKGITWLATKFGASAILSTLGTIIPGIGNVVGLIAGFLIDKARGLLSSLLQRIKKPEVALGLAIGGVIFIIGVPGTIGLILGVPLLALSGAGFAAGAGGILGGFATGVEAFFVALAAPFAAPIGLLVGGIIGGLAIITFFIVMLTASAFIIPAKPVAEIEEAQSVYIEVDKTANPTKIAVPPVEISYTIQITAKQETITNIRIDNQTMVTNENRSFPITKDISCPANLNPGETCTKEYIIKAEGPDFENSAILDTVMVLADVPSKNLTNERSSASASVIIGNPPLYCFVFKDRDIMSRWRDEDKVIEIQAISELSRRQKYIGKLCANGTINLIREYSNPWYSGEAHGANEIALFNKNFSSVGNAIFTLAHESGHVYSHRRGGDYKDFLGSGIYQPTPKGEGFICSYPSRKSEAEDFAEMIANYVRLSKNPCFGNEQFNKKYPLHYKFVGHVIFEDF
jgi:Zn-dependent peptidase ImmA (M78 family)